MFLQTDNIILGVCGQACSNYSKQHVLHERDRERQTETETDRQRQTEKELKFKVKER